MTRQKGQIQNCQVAAPQTNMGKLRRIVAVLYPGMVALDLVGPIEAFNYATMILADAAEPYEGGYEIDIAGLKAGPVDSVSALRFHADTSIAEYTRPVDILLIPGMRSGDYRYRDPALLNWINEQAGRSQRLVSICSGVFVLAEAGLLSNTEVTTHWMDSADLRAAFPELIVSDDEIYCKSGDIYTSGGVTAGIDLALAIISEDYGNALALKVAKRMIVYLKRAGNQAQFSDLLHAQSNASRFSELLEWIETKLQDKLDVAQLSEKCSMSPRNFSRLFRKELGVSPKKYVTRRRLDRVRSLLEETNLPAKVIASRSGFGSPDKMTRAFSGEFDVTPMRYRDLHS